MALTTQLTVRAGRYATGPGRRQVEGAIALGAAILGGAALAKLGTASFQIKAIMLVVGSVLLVIAALRPVFGLALMVSMAPFNIAYLNIGTNNTLLYAIAALVVWRIRLIDMPVWMRLGAGAVLAGSFITVVVAHDPGQAIIGAMRWLAVIVLLGAACTCLKGNAKAGERVATIFAVTGVVQVLFVMAQRVGITALVGPEYAPGHVDGFFGYYTVLAGFLGLAGVVVTGEVLHALQTKRPGRALAMGGALAVILLGVGVAESRGGLLCIGGGWAVLLAFSASRASMIVRVIALVAVLGAAGFLATPPATRTSFQQRFSQPLGSTSSDKTRFALHKAGRDAAKSSPLGLGYGNFRYYLLEKNPSSLITFAFFHAHQLFIQVALDSGWLGLAGFLLLGLWPFVLALRRAAGRGALSARGLGAVAALGGFAAQGLYDYLLYEVSILILIVVVVWLAWFELAGPGAAADAS